MMIISLGRAILYESLCFVLAATVRSLRIARKNRRTYRTTHLFPRFLRLIPTAGVEP